MRTIVQSSIAALGFLVLAQGVSAQETTVLRVSHGFEGHHAELMEALVVRFEQKHPEIDVDLYLGGPNWDNHLQATLRAGIIDDLPDISHQSLTFTRQYVSLGYAQPFTGLFDLATLAGKFGLPEPLLASATFNGEVYGIPFGTTIPLIYYNMDIMRKAGYQKEELPATWPEVIAAAKAMASVGGNTVGGYIEYDASNAWMFQNLLAAHGGTLTNETETEAAFISPAGTAALKVLEDFAPAMNADMTRKQGRQAFNAGSVGLLVRSASGIKTISKAAQGKFEVRVGNFPVPSAKGKVVGATHGVVLFAKAEAQRKAAAKYVEFLVGPEGQSVLAKETGYMPVSSVAVKDREHFGDFYEKNPLQRGLLKMIPITSDWYSFPNETLRIFDIMKEQMRRVVTGEAKADAALNDMGAQVSPLMASK